MEDLNKLSKKELVERLSKQNSSVDDGLVRYSEHESELQKVDRIASVSNPHRIPFRETSDHKNIMLYTAINKRVGPLHPDNAKRTMERWKRAGVQLYVTPRTPEQVEAFKQTDEYKRYHEKHIATRKLRRQQSSKGRTEKMVEEVAKAVAAGMSGKVAASV
jgi:hypothetical protein